MALKVFEYNMSTELPWSTRVFLIVKLSISTYIIIGLSCVGSIPLKSSSVNVIGGILGRAETRFNWWTARRCFLRALLELPPPANPPAMVLITSRPLRVSACGGSSLRPCRSPRLSPSRGPGGVRSLLLGVCSLHGERCASRVPRTKRLRCPT